MSGSSEVCPCCGKKLVKFLASPLDNLGCPVCGSLHTVDEDGSWCEISSSTGLIVLVFTCAVCGFEWLEGRVLPKKTAALGVS